MNIFGKILEGYTSKYYEELFWGSRLLDNLHLIIFLLCDEDRGKKTQNNPLPFQACLLGRDLWVVVLKAQTSLKNNCLEILSEWDSWTFLEVLDRRTWKFGDGTSSGPLSLEGPCGKKDWHL